ncbi:hypothetical protein [Mycolicibacterium hodleri]|uniref:hypothetical protein n=1 Tax=Mycolicibacterium hodleri TaxID=49897 RepID=UPI0013760D38|nr:hypothetical protein [Mycolicibacterium hodleri]
MNVSLSVPDLSPISAGDGAVSRSGLQPAIDCRTAPQFVGDPDQVAHELIAERWAS